MSNDYKFSEKIKTLKHFTKINDHTWFVQRNKESMCESFYVSMLPRCIVMYGDYGGVIVQPYGVPQEGLVGWMAGATSINYFCEKVRNGNEYHKLKDWDDDEARNAYAEYLGGMEYSVRDSLEGGTYEGEITKEDVERIKKIFCDGAFVSDFTDLSKEKKLLLDAVEDYTHFDDQKTFQDSMWELGESLGFHVECEDLDIGEDYHFRIKWQHECLLWWANHVLENE